MSVGIEITKDHLHYLRKVSQNHHRKYHRYISYEEIYSAGSVGLVKAASKFDSSKNSCFNAFAYKYISGAIVDEIRSLCWAPRSLVKRAKVTSETLQTFCQFPERDLEDEPFDVPENRPQPFDVVAEWEEASRLKTAIASLNPRDRAVVELYYFDHVTMRDISSILGVVESRVSQLHASVIKQLRTKLQPVSV